MGLNVSAAYIGAGGFQNAVETDRQILQWLVGDFNRISATTDFVVTPVAGEHKVSVSAGRAFLRGVNTPGSQGSYFVWSDSADTVDMPVPQSNPFFATLILRSADPQYGTVTGTVGARWDVVSGAAASSPVAISDAGISALNVPGGWMRVADIRINPADTGAIPAGQITDTRPPVQVTRADVICTSTTRPPHMMDLRIFESDTKFSYISDGAAWHFLSGPSSGWTAPLTLNVSWDTYTTFRSRLLNGIVYLKGLIRHDSGVQNGASAADILTLPVGHRPSDGRDITATRWVAGATPDKTAEALIRVEADGTVDTYVVNPPVTGVIVDGISFPASGF